MFKQIVSFKNVIVKPQTLIVFDIDDTIIGYEEFSHTYFTNAIENYKEKYNCDKMALDFALHDWISKVNEGTPCHMDADGFKELERKIKNTNSHYIFMTARNPNYRDITETHLEQVGIKNRQVYYLAGANKGEFLKNIYEKYSDYKEIIFIDDMEKNLHDVGKAFDHKIELYHFVKKYNH